MKQSVKNKYWLSANVILVYESMRAKEQLNSGTK